MNKKHILAAVIAATLSTGMIASGVPLVFAGDDLPAGSKAPAKEQTADKGSDQKNQETKAAEKDLIKVSEDALLSMRDLHTARLAIFNGQPDRARTYVDAAMTRISAAVKDADKYALEIKAPPEEDIYIPYDASFMVMDTYEPTKENAKSIAKANEHLHKGEKKQAIEALKLGKVDVGISTGLIPVQLAKTHIEQAAKFLAESKYYEANLVLKAVDDAVVVQTFAIDETPKAKSESTEMAKEKAKD
jgi:hypothetical protein